MSRKPYDYIVSAQFLQLYHAAHDMISTADDLCMVDIVRYMAEAYSRPCVCVVKAPTDAEAARLANNARIYVKNKGLGGSDGFVISRRNKTIRLVYLGGHDDV